MSHLRWENANTGQGLAHSHEICYCKQIGGYAILLRYVNGLKPSAFILWLECFDSFVYLITTTMLLIELSA